jgi:uncharacterized protein (TIGR02147 family)
VSSLYLTKTYRALIQLALEERGLTQRDLAQAIDRCKSSVSQMLSGSRGLDPALVDPIARFLKLDPEETAYFAALVDLSIGTARARRLASASVRARQLQEAEGENHSDLVGASSKWYYWPVIELSACEGFRRDPAWVAGTLLPPISVAEADDALSTSVALGLVAPEASAEIESQRVWSPSDVRGEPDARAAAERFLAGLELAAGCLERARFNERHVSTTTFRVSESQFERIRARLRELEQEIVVMASEPTEPTNRVYQLQVQLFPVSLYTDSTVDHSIFASSQGEPPDIDPDTTE